MVFLGTSPPVVENMEEKEIRVRRISPFLSSKSGSECFLPMSAMERTKGMRLLSFLSFWWWCFFSIASRTLARKSSFSWPDATMLSITMSEVYKGRSMDINISMCYESSKVISRNTAKFTCNFLNTVGPHIQHDCAVEYAATQFK